MTESEAITLYTDGASRGNPGPAAWAFVIVRDGIIIDMRSGFLGETTNNVAEYQAVINGLAAARRYTRGRVDVRSDSELAVRQLTGWYRVRKEHLAVLHREALRLAGSFREVTFASVPREHPFIRIADGLCNETIDRHADRQDDGRGGA